MKEADSASRVETYNQPQMEAMCHFAYAIAFQHKVLTMPRKELMEEMECLGLQKTDPKKLAFIGVRAAESECDDLGLISEMHDIVTELEKKWKEE